MLFCLSVKLGVEYEGKKMAIDSVGEQGAGRGGVVSFKWKEVTE